MITRADVRDAESYAIRQRIGFARLLVVDESKAPTDDAKAQCARITVLAKDEPAKFEAILREQIGERSVRVWRPQFQEDSMSYRVVYGESRPAWEQIFPTKRKAEAFAKKHRSFGDVIFSIAKVVPGEPPQSMAAAIAAQR